MFTMSEDQARAMKRSCDTIYFIKLNHNRLKHIKEIIEGPRDPRPGGIPKPKEEKGYLTIYITIRPQDQILLDGEKLESHL
mgnify:CR=1 FL=1